MLTTLQIPAIPLVSRSLFPSAQVARQPAVARRSLSTIADASYDMIAGLTDDQKMVRLLAPLLLTCWLHCGP